MTFVQRYTAPLLARIPDLSDVPTGRVILIGIIVSLLLHLLVFLLIPVISLFFPDREVDFAKEFREAARDRVGGHPARGYAAAL